MEEIRAAHRVLVAKYLTSVVLKIKKEMDR
jgi:hypothetical protein